MSLIKHVKKMKYNKVIDGQSVVKEASRIIIRTNGRQIFNPTEEQLLADGWMPYATPAPTLDQLKDRKRDELLAFDSSTEVNEFSIGGTPVWLDKATRAGLILRFQAEQASGQAQTTLWYEGQQFTLDVADAIAMLYAIELYASACYDRTQAHLLAIDGLNTAEDVESYDYTTGYPEKIIF